MKKQKMTTIVELLLPALLFLTILAACQKQEGTLDRQKSKQQTPTEVLPGVRTDGKSYAAAAKGEQRLLKQIPPGLASNDPKKLVMEFVALSKDRDWDKLLLFSGLFMDEIGEIRENKPEILQKKLINEAGTKWLRAFEEKALWLRDLEGLFPATPSFGDFPVSYCALAFPPDVECEVLEVKANEVKHEDYRSYTVYLRAKYPNHSTAPTAIIVSAFTETYLRLDSCIFEFTVENYTKNTISKLLFVANIRRLEEADEGEKVRRP